MKHYGFLSILLAPMISFAGYVPYCQGTTANNAEDAVIQRLVTRFTGEAPCNVGESCLLKWDLKGETEKFSLDRPTQCGSKDHEYILSENDNKYGATFECRWKNKTSICCWPHGYEKNKKWVLCSDNIIKKKVS